MNWRKVGKFFAIFYLILYVAAMVTPRKFLSGHIASTHSFSLKRFFHQILNYGGPFEPFANFFFLIPIFAILVAFLGKSRALLNLVICICCAATAETLQDFIPGRVSSVRDFTLNSIGAIVAFLVFKICNYRKVNP